MNEGQPFDHAETPEQPARAGLPLDHSATTSPHAPGSPSGFKVRCPHCHNPIQLADDCSDQVLCPACGSGFYVQDTHLPCTSATLPVRMTN
jgi:hypothetical protein